jgi:uncharacterized protein
MVSKSKCVAATTIGYMAIALSGWMISTFNSGWFSKFYERGLSLSLVMAIVLLVAGVLAYLQNQSLDAVVFFGMFGMRAVFYQYRVSGAIDPPAYLGVYFVAWTIFFGYVWLASFKSGILRMLFLLALTITLLAECVGNGGNVNSVIIASGYLGEIAWSLAALVSAVTIIQHGQNGDPNQSPAGA